MSTEINTNNPNGIFKPKVVDYKDEDIFKIGKDGKNDNNDKNTKNKKDEK